MTAKRFVRGPAATGFFSFVLLWFSLPPWAAIPAEPGNATTFWHPLARYVKYILTFLNFPLVIRNSPFRAWMRQRRFHRPLLILVGAAPLGCVFHAVSV